VHFEVLKNGHEVNPVSFVRMRRDPRALSAGFTGIRPDASRPAAPAAIARN
jgi:hypothetical protein